MVFQTLSDYSGRFDAPPGINRIIIRGRSAA